MLYDTSECQFNPAWWEWYINSKMGIVSIHQSGIRIFLKSVDITKESRENTLNMRKSTGDILTQIWDFKNVNLYCSGVTYDC